MSFTVYRPVFTGRILGTAQAVRTMVHIGRGIEALAGGPSGGGPTIDDIKPTDADALVLAVTAVFSYTGGATNPTLDLRVQRKLDDVLADTADAAWEDIAAFRALIASTPTNKYEVLNLANVLQTGDNLNILTNGAYESDFDDLPAGSIRPVLLTQKLRIRETVSGGDRTGGTLSYAMHLLLLGKVWGGGW